MKRYIFIVFICLLSICQYSCHNDKNLTYYDTLAQSRKEKDNYFKTHAQSPIKQSERSRFKGLQYFLPDTNAIVHATFKEYKDNDSSLIITGNKQVIGIVQFSYKSQKASLFVYSGEGQKGIFIPFRDATTGKTSYGGGRFLEAQVNNNKTTLDFNLAYHPYCLYNEQYTCPLPPQANTLRFAIEAGEKLPDEYRHE